MRCTYRSVEDQKQRQNKKGTKHYTKKQLKKTPISIISMKKKEHFQKLFHFDETKESKRLHRKDKARTDVVRNLEPNLSTTEPRAAKRRALQLQHPPIIEESPMRPALIAQ